MNAALKCSSYFAGDVPTMDRAECVISLILIEKRTVKFSFFCIHRASNDVFESRPRSRRYDYKCAFSGTRAGPCVLACLPIPHASSCVSLNAPIFVRPETVDGELKRLLWPPSAWPGTKPVG